MHSLVNEIIKGRKTFFIAPDRTLFPQSYLEEYLVLGYECYFIDTDIFLPIEVKVDIILSVFKDSILFFNVDAPVQGTSWAYIIKEMQEKYPSALFGVLYAKRHSTAERQSLEHQYLYAMGIQCGCIQLEYQKRDNFQIIEQVLYANQAMGRRKYVRALCSSSCSFSFSLERQGVMQNRLTDISISHFSFVLPEGQLRLDDYEKVSDIVFTIHGLRFRSDAVLYMTRPVDNGILFVFAFQTKSGQSGLDPVNKQLLTPKLYEIMLDNCMELLNRLFASASRKRENAITDLQSID
ncbi:MAG: hypothetical protein J5527_00880 [Treponema sp.]|nr:hypothetical protein [Treponema sp.]